MVKTVRCPQCSIVLNLPENIAAGKRLKCPKCAARFVVGADSLKNPSTERSDHDASPESSQELPRRHSDPELPVASGDLRDTFDLPLLSEMTAGGPGGKASGPHQAADALALFEEKRAPAKRPSNAEARSSARRCATCGTVVPKGMSVCSTCGLDQETGMRIELDDDLMPEAPQRVASTPLPVTVIALITLLGSSIFAIVSLVQWLQHKDGWQYFIPVSAFGIFAAVQLLRGHSPKLLLIALSMGAMINVFALIFMPIYTANQEMVAQQQRPTNPDEADVIIQSVAERLDTQSLTTGIVLLLVYAAVSAYLISPAVRRHSSRS